MQEHDMGVDQALGTLKELFPEDEGAERESPLNQIYPDYDPRTLRDMTYSFIGVHHI
jgi:hypothetical protein